MIQKAMKFTPEAMLSAPRRSAGVINTLGTQILYTSSSYDFGSHTKETALTALDTQIGGIVPLARNQDISDMHWLDDAGDNFICLQAKSDGTTDVCVAYARWSAEALDSWEKRHYVAGTVDGAAGNLKIVKLDGRGEELAFVVSAQAGKDGGLFNAEKAPMRQSTGKLYTGLFVRHWDRWETGERNALWYGKLSKDKHGEYKMSTLTNALKGTNLECPIRPFGGTDHFDISHNRIVFVSKDPDLNPALHTKSNVYIRHINSWDAEDNTPTLQRVIIPGFEGASTSPVISPDGSKAAFLSMKAAGYEADKNQIFVLPDLDTTELVPQRAFAESGNYEGTWDRSPSSICFAPDSRSLLVIAEDYGYSRVFILKADLTNESQPRRLTNWGYVGECKGLPDGRIFISGSTLVDNSFYGTIDPLLPPAKQNEPAALTWTSSNSGKGNKFGLSPDQVSSIWTPASNKKINKEVHSIVVKPSHFDSSKKYPVAYLIHGGPQGSWADNWSTRWNPAVFAEQGYIVIAPNPTGSTGYGQAFTDAIRENWGGDPYQDIVNCFEWVGKNMPEADNSRAVALGASYGGYMMNWIQGHDLGRKFKALVCHDGILTTAGMLATEELYFPFTDMGDPKWYASSEAAAKHSRPKNSTFADWRKWDPAEHFDKWATPELVIHNSKDFRICISDGLAAFNVLQARGVESQFLTFPDENHWVLKPENGLAWHKVVLNWINKHVGLPAYTEEDADSEEFWGGVRGEKEEVAEMVAQGKPET